MIKWPPEHAEMEKVESALIRAGQAARDFARQHGVPVVVWKDGQVVLEHVEEPPPKDAGPSAWSPVTMRWPG
jgi:hypothetical protein